MVLVAVLVKAALQQLLVLNLLQSVADGAAAIRRQSTVTNLEVLVVLVVLLAETIRTQKQRVMFLVEWSIRETTEQAVLGVELPALMVAVAVAVAQPQQSMLAALVIR